MEIAMGAIGPLLPRLTNLLVGEFTLEKRVRKGIESLMTELTLMHAALCKVAKVPPDQLDEGDKIWAGKVKELSYQMQDIVDTFLVRVEDGGKPTNPRNRVKKILKKTFKLFKKAKDLHSISDALEEVVGQAKQLAEVRQRYETGNDNGVGASIDPRVMALYKDVTELIGIEDTRDELINMLIEGDDWLNHPLKTVSIVGFGGLGKTTLAKAAYDKIKVQFDCDAFVPVSQNPDMKKVLKDILFELDKRKYAHIHNESREERHLINELIEFLDDKRYLIVIDDIWDEKAWKIIKCAFSKKSVGSRLITTTRIVTVAEACCSSSGDIYRMRALSKDVSRSLFYKRVFSDEKRCPHELVQVSKEILKKCGGIPLAIITIASLLASNCEIKPKDQWCSLLNSIGCGLTENPSVEEMKKILLFSYYDLPFHLRPCLLYLCIFPEDYKIPRDKLVWMWIAEGLVYSEKQDICLYELGVSYFNELINRHMIQLVDIDGEERVESCRVHDMVLDIICSLSSEENFVTILDGTERKVPKLQSKVHRLSIHKSNIDLPSTSMTQVRSVIVFGNDIVNLVPLISRAKVLRVLAFKDCTTAISDIQYVENLSHLRYLELHTDICMRELQMDMGKLHFLQILDLSKRTRLDRLPSSIVLLRNLMCLYGNCFLRLPPGMNNLTSLEVLSGFQLGGSYIVDHNLDLVRELCQMTKLRVLVFGWSLMDDSMAETLLHNLSNMHRLEKLWIAGDSHKMHKGWVPPPQLRSLEIEKDIDILFESLPSWINQSFLPVLSCLEITVREVRPGDIQLLGMLPSLRYLRFCITSRKSLSTEAAGEMLVVAADAFPYATKLSFIGIPVMPSTFPPGAAPRLKYLGFCFPTRWIARGDLDMGIGHLPSLESVRVDLWDEKSSDSEKYYEVIDVLIAKAEAALRAAASDHPNRPDLRTNWVPCEQSWTA